MVKRGSFCASCCLLVMISVGIGLCQDQEIDVRAKRYYTLLEKRPGSVQLFDRFYDAWLDTGTLEALEEYLNSQLAANPNVTHHLVMASFFERQGKHVESLRLYREAAERDPENGEVLYLKAQAELRTLDFDSAIFDLERARTLQLSGNLSEKCAKLLGKLYVRTTQNDKAQAVWQQLLQDNPQDEDLYEDLIELQLAEGLYEGAIATSDQLLAITKDSYEKVMRKLRRGDILQYSGKNEEALTAYASCLSLVGNGTWLEDQITAQIERVFRREDNLSGLREYYAKLIKADAQRFGLRTRLARLLLQMNRHDEALAIYQEILKVTPGDKDNQKAYVAALSKARQFGKAIDLLTQMHQQHANDRELLIQLAELYQQNKQGEQAAQALETFVTQSEKTEYLFLRVGRILERYELADQAEGLYQQLAETFPESLGAKEAYAQFLLRAEKTEAALALWQEIAHAGDVAMLVRAAQTVSRHNHREQALEWLESQYASYSDDMTYLATLCQIGQRLKQYDKALVWARRQLEISERFSRIKSAVAQVVAVAKRGKQTTDLIDELAAQGTRSIQQTCLLAELYDSVYMSTEADALLAQVGKDHQEMALKQQIRLCRLRRDWSLAAQKTEALLAQTGTRDSLYVRELVDLYRKDGNYEQALAWIPTWKKTSPGNAQAWLTESQLLADSGKENDAISVLRRADQAFEGRAEILARLANLYTRASRTGDAERIYWRLYETAKAMSDKIRWIRDMGQAAMLSGSQEGIIEKLKERKRDNPSSIVPCLALAEMYRQMDQYEERRQVLFEATRIQSQDVGLLHEIARIEEQEGEWEQALETLRRALPLDGTQKTRQKMARIHILYGDEDTGYRLLFDLAGGTAMTPRDARAIADAMASGQNWALVIDFLEGILDQHPQDYKLHYLYAVALEEDGRDEQALDAFLALLGMTEEIPGNTEKPIPSPWAQAGFNITELMPPAAMELMETQNHYRRVFAYRRGRRGSTFRVSGSAGAATISLPPTVDDLQAFSVCHIIGLSHLLDEEAQQSVEFQLQQAGVGSPKVLMAWGMAGLENLYQSIDTLAEDYPDNQAVQAVWVLYRMNTPNADPGRYEAVFNLFAEDRPRLASLAGLLYGAGGGSDPNVLTRSLQMLDSIAEPGFYEMMGVTTALQGSLGQEGLPQDIRSILSQKLVAWYRSDGVKGNNRVYLFSRVAASLAQNEDLTEFVQFLDEEVRSDPGGSNLAAQTMFFGRSRNDELISPLPYPPQQLPKFPASVLQLVFPGQRNPYLPNPEGLGLETESLLEYIEAARDPTLKIVMLLAAGQMAQAQEKLDALVAAESPSLTAFVLAATLATEQEKPQMTLALLEKARFLPMDSRHRQRLDAAIVASALDLDPNSHAVEVSVGQKAALRLRRNRMSHDQRTELAEAMDTLGLTQEAAKLAKQPAPARPAGRGPTPVFRSSSSSAPQQRIQDLFNKGKRDAALRLILTDLRNLALGSLYPQQQNYIFGGRTDPGELVGLIRAHKAMDAFMTLADPGDTNSVRKLNQFARICEMLDKRERARAAYETVLSKRPKDVTARVQLALLLGAEDPQAGATQLGFLDQRRMDQVAPTLANLVQGRFQREGTKEALDIVEVLAAYVETIEDPNRTPLQWVTRVVETIEQPSYGRTVRLGHLFQAESENSRNESEMGERRRKIHNDLCRIMLQVPQLSVQGFARLAAEAKARAAITDEFPTLAKEALLRARPYRGRPAQGFQQRFFYSSSSRNQIGRPVDPIEFLLRDSLEQGKIETFVPEFAAKLRENNLPELATRLDQMAALYRDSADAFLEAAHVLLREVSKPKRVEGSLLSGADCLVWVVDAHAQRELSVDVVPFLLDQIEKDLRASQMQGRPTPQWHIQHCLTRLAERNSAGAQQCLEAIVTLYVGPKARRKALVEKHYDRRRIMSNSPNGRIHACFQLLRTLAKDRGLFFSLVDYAQQMPPLARDLRSSLEGVLQMASETDPNEIMTFLQASPFLAEVGDFTTLPYPGMKYNSVYAHFIRQLTGTGGGSSPRRGVQVALLVRLRDQTQTLGVRLLTAHLSGNPAQAIHETLATSRQAIEARDEAWRRELAFMVTDSLGSIDAASRQAWTRENQQSYDWLTALSGGADRGAVAALMNAKTLQSLQIEARAFDRYVAETLVSVMDSNPDRAKAVLLKAKALVEQADKKGQWRYTPAIRFVDYVFQRSAKGMGPLRLAVELIRDVNTPFPPIAIEAPRRHHEAVSTLYEAVEDASDPDPLKRVQRFYERLGGHFGQGNLSGVLACFKWPFDAELTGEQLQAIRQWAEQETATGRYPGVAQELLTHARLAKPVDGGSQQVAAEVMDAIQTQYAKVLDDESLSVAWRILVLRQLLVHEEEGLWEGTQLCNAALLHQGLSLLARCWREESVVPQGYFRRLLTRAAGLSATPELCTRVSEVTEAYHVYLGRVARVHGGETHLYYTAYNRRVQLPLLEMNLKCGDPDGARKLLEVRSLASNLDAWALLVEHGQMEQARSFMRSRWQEVGRKSDHRFTARFAANLDACLSEIQEPEIRYYSELLLAALPDGQAEEAPVQKREARLVELAGRFFDHSFSTEGVKQRALLVLGGSDRALALVADVVAEEARGIDLGAACSLRVTAEREAKSSLVLLYSRAALAQGDPNVFRSSIDSVVAARDRLSMGRGYQHERVLEQMAKHLREFVDTLGPDWTPGQMGGLANLSARLVGTSTRYYTLNQRRRLWDYCPVLHVLAGQEGLVEAAHAQISGDVRGQFRYYVDQKATFEAFAKFIQSQDLQQKIATLGRYFALAGIQETVRWNGGIRGPVYSLAEYGVLTDQEILAHAAQLADFANLPIRNWEQVAVIQVKHDMIKEAEVSWRRSIAACGQADKAWRQTQAYCRFLEKQGQAKEALSYVQEIDTQDWSPKLKNERQTWLANWKDETGKKKGKQVSNATSSERSRSVSR